MSHPDLGGRYEEFSILSQLSPNGSAVLFVRLVKFVVKLKRCVVGR